MNDFWIQFSCFSFKVLALCMLALRQTVIVYWDDYIQPTQPLFMLLAHLSFSCNSVQLPDKAMFAAKPYWDYLNNHS